MKTDDKLQKDVKAELSSVPQHDVLGQPGTTEKKRVSGPSGILLDITLTGNDAPKRNAWDTLRHRWQRLSGSREV